MAQASVGVITLLVLGVVYAVFLSLFSALRRKKPKWNLTKKKIVFFSVLALLLFIAVFVALSAIAEAVFGPPNFI